MCICVAIQRGKLNSLKHLGRRLNGLSKLHLSSRSVRLTQKILAGLHALSTSPGLKAGHIGVALLTMLLISQGLGAVLAWRKALLAQTTHCCTLPSIRDRPTIVAGPKDTTDCLSLSTYPGLLSAIVSRTLPGFFFFGRCMAAGVASLGSSKLSHTFHRETLRRPPHHVIRRRRAAHLG